MTEEEMIHMSAKFAAYGDIEREDEYDEDNGWIDVIDFSHTC